MRLFDQKTLLFLAISQLTSATLGAPGARPSDPFEVYLTIRRQALATSWDMKRVVLQKLQAQKELEQTETKTLPQIDLAGQWGRRVPDATSFKNQNYTLDVTYGLYDFGRADADHQASIFAERLKSLSVQELDEQLSWRIARMVLKVRSAMVLRQVVASNLTTSQDKHAKIKANYREGLRPQYDLAVAEADLNNSELLLARADSDLTLAVEQLKIFMNDQSLPPVMESLQRYIDQGESQSGSFDGQPLKGTHLKGAMSGDKNTPDQWYKRSTTWPISVTTTKKQEQIQEIARLGALVEQVDTSDNPTLLLGLEAAHGGTWDKTSSSYQGLLTLKWTIPWSGQHRLDREILALRRSQAEATIAQDEVQLNDDLNQAVRKLQLAQRIWKALEKVYQSKGRVYHLTKERYDSGKASALEMTNAELDLGSVKLEKARVNNSAAEAALDIAIAKGVKDLSVVLR